MGSSSPDWQAETTLDSAIGGPTRPGRPQLPARAVLLTGATGFVGAHVLGELLGRTQADLYCLVRPEADTPAEERLRRHLKQLGIAHPDAEQRIKIVRGELGEADLALSAADYSLLADKLDSIYHIGGVVNAVQSYSVLRGPNVFGTQEVIRLAASGQPKTLHLVSTISIFLHRDFATGEVISESDKPLGGEYLSSAYTQSKWVAEQLVNEAQRRNLPTAIYRTIRISGHSETGAFTNGDRELWILLLAACAALEVYPDWDIDLPMVPVDYVSKAIVQISMHDQCAGHVYHIVDHQPLRWREVIGALKDHGYRCEPVAYESWIKALKRRILDQPERKDLRRLWIMLNAPNNLFKRKPRFDTRNLDTALTGSGIAPLRIDANVLGRYIERMQDNGYLPPPAYGHPRAASAAPVGNERARKDSAPVEG